MTTAFRQLEPVASAVTPALVSSRVGLITQSAAQVFVPLRLESRLTRSLVFERGSVIEIADEMAQSLGAVHSGLAGVSGIK